jgi:hypothetical protein
MLSLTVGGSLLTLERERGELVCGGSVVALIVLEASKTYNWSIEAIEKDNWTRHNQVVKNFDASLYAQIRPSAITARISFLRFFT